MSIKSKLNIEKIRKACSKPMSEKKIKLLVQRKDNHLKFLDYISEISKVCKDSNAMIPINRARRLKLYGRE